MDGHAEPFADPNLAYLDAELRLLRLRLEGDASGEASQIARFLADLRVEAASRRDDLCVPRLAAAFGLDDFERQLLLLAAAPELDATFGERIARAQGTDEAWPTVALAWRILAPATAAWLESRDSLRDDAPLFRFELVHASPAGPLPARTLRADRRVADALLGRRMPDARLTPFVRWADPVPDGGTDPAAARLARCVAEHLTDARSGPLVVHLYGSPEADLQRFAAACLRHLGLPLLAGSAVPGGLAVPFLREALLGPCGLLLGNVELAEWARTLTSAGPLVFVASAEPHARPAAIDASAWLPVEVGCPATPRRESLWAVALADVGIAPDAVAMLSRNFMLGASEIHATTRLAVNLARLRGAAPDVDDVIRACRAESRHRMTDLAQRLRTAATWEDLVLPPDCTDKLRELCAQVESQPRVLDEFGFAALLARGRGVTGLFAGPSGTGKTMAAEVVANALGRELYRVDLARVMSKYIGETEKNLRQIFAEAERARCVVLFDEADALYGHRTQVRDSRDRYANIEVSYLLQLIEESEAAVVLLATNRRDAIDEAFLRRFRFIVDFPMPDGDLRRRLWERSFPGSLPVRDVSFETLAEQLALSGGNIKNIAVGAASLAASDGGVVTADLLIRAARRELDKLGRPAALTEADLAPRGGLR